MLVNLVSTFLLASALLAQTSSGLPQAGSFDGVDARVERDTSDSDRQSPDTAYWAGVLLEVQNISLDFVTGSFKVPSVRGPANSAATVSLGIDSAPLCSSVLLAGVNFFVGEHNEPSYAAWIDWYPDGYQAIQNFPVSAGDVIHIAVNLISSTSGAIIFENLTKQNTVVQRHDSIHPLCGATAEWSVSSFTSNGRPLTLANFGTVTITDGAAYGKGTSTFHPQDGGIMVTENGIQTSVEVKGSSVQINRS